MEVKITNGDTELSRDGNFVRCTGAEEIFARGLICLKIKRGKYYPLPKLGCDLSAEKTRDISIKQCELIMNEAVHGVEGLYIKVNEIIGERVLFTMSYKGSTMDAQVSVR